MTQAQWDFVNESDPSVGLMVESDGRVCHAYLLGGLPSKMQILSDVWLYNCVPAGATPEWEIRDGSTQPPFLNPPHLGVQSVDPVQSGEEIEARFSSRTIKQKKLLRTVEVHMPAVDIHVRGEHWATLIAGQTPGECRHATEDGPLARCLVAPDRKDGGLA